MRTKTILLTAAVLAAGLGASVAQSVFSVNAVGYVNVPLLSGYNMICNPLNAPTNTIGALINKVPNGTSLLKWDNTIGDFLTYTFAFGNWNDENGPNNDVSLAPGEGCFIFVNTATNVTFVGDVLQGNLTNTLVVGYTMVSSKVPQTGLVTALGISPTTLQNGSSLLKWNNAAGDYDTYGFAFGGWTDPNGDPNEPSISVGEAVFISSQSIRQWTRSFSVN